MRRSAIDTPPDPLSAGARRQIDALLAAQPEAASWLGVLSAVLAESAAPRWETMASATRLSPERAPAAPLLAGAVIPVDPRAAERWVREVLRIAADAGPEAASLRAAAESRDLAPLDMLAMAINAEGDHLDAAAITLGASPEALAVAAGLASIPLLQAVRRRFGAAVAAHWSEGYCPVCGDWPLLAEQRGLERARRLRCGRCGSDWAQPGIRCPYCNVTGHAARAALIPETDSEARRVEICYQCRGYLKSVSTLRAWAGDEIPLADMATVDLDLAALAREYERPGPRTLRPGVTVVTADG
ncbi:MAG: formate dehydrogenase accessory protein FdhE [Thermomicrobiales bacterium]|nr:formate dehydrogenase accessory protein FdhE [Thermomicrobiales bacterium]